VIILETKSQ
jgi:hypothetical protein